MAWWRNYGRRPGQRLHLVACFDGPQLIGLLPCYRQLTPKDGCCVRWPVAKSARNIWGFWRQKIEHTRSQKRSAIRSGTGRQTDLSRTWELMLFDAQDAGDEALCFASRTFGEVIRWKPSPAWSVGV